MTTLSDIFDLAELSAEIDGGFVKANRHPLLPLTIYTYTRDCQYDGHWTPVTTQCRGLIADDSGQVVARPFPKFFNYGEHGVRDYALPLPVESFDVYEKVDGSLGIVFYYGGEWRVASKGSFISDQARWAQKRLDLTPFHGLTPGITYCAEIIYPENRIVVNYGDREDLVLLGAFWPNGSEIHLDGVRTDWDCIGSVVKTYAAPTLERLLEMTASNVGWGGNEPAIGGTDAEGFVLRLKSGIRTKVKYAEYVRLHRLLTGITERDVWRAVAFDSMVGLDLNVAALSRTLRCSPLDVAQMQAAPNGAVATIVDGCPDEFDQWVQGIVKTLRQQFNMMSIESKVAFARTREVAGLHDRALFAKTLTANWSHNKTIVSSVFSILDRKPVDPLIWRSLYPSASTPFREDEES